MQVNLQEYFEKKAWTEFIGPILGGMVGMKGSQLLATPISVVSPTAGRVILGAGILGGGVGGYMLGKSFSDRRREMAEQALLEAQKNQLGLL